MNDNHYPKGSSRGGQFASKENSYSESVTEHIRWARDNGVRLPLNDDGSVDGERLRKIYEQEKRKAESLSDFVARVKSGNAKDGETLELDEITDRARKDIERLTGQTLNATKHVISATEIAHILYRHGENGQADHSMSTMKDFEDVLNVLRNYDSLSLANKKSKFRNGRGENASVILYKKRLNKDTQIVTEAVTDGKKGKLRILSVYKTHL